MHSEPCEIAPTNVQMKSFSCSTLHTNSNMYVLTGNFHVYRHIVKEEAQGQESRLYVLLNFEMRL